MTTPVKRLVLLLAAPMLMGNEGCEQQAVDETPAQGRRLRQQVELSKIQSPKISFPGAENFDFEFVLNAQIYDAINADDRFVVAFSSSDLRMPAALTPADRLALTPPNGWRPSLQSLDVDPFDPQQCVARAPLMMIGGQVRSFEVVSRGGLWFGFTPQGTGNGSMGGETSIIVQNAQMEIGMVAYNPLSKTLLGTGLATPKHTKIDINLSIDFGTFSLGPRYFYQSRIAGVTMNGLKESLRLLGNDLEAKALKENRAAWETRVVKDYDTHVTVRAGKRHGLMVGDEFEVYNLDHYWEDDTQPCRSRYLGSVRNTDMPIAILKVAGDRDLGDEFARLEVVKGTENGSRRLPGAQIVVHKLVEPVQAAPPPAKAPEAPRDQPATPDYPDYNDDFFSSPD